MCRVLLARRRAPLVSVERGSERERECVRKRESDKEREREREYVRVCVCERERGRQQQRESERVSEYLILLVKPLSTRVVLSKSHRESSLFQDDSLRKGGKDVNITQI